MFCDKQIIFHKENHLLANDENYVLELFSTRSWSRAKFFSGSQSETFWENVECFKFLLWQSLTIKLANFAEPKKAGLLGNKEKIWFVRWSDNSVISRPRIYLISGFVFLLCLRYLPVIFDGFDERSVYCLLNQLTKIFNPQFVKIMDMLLIF